MTSDTLTGRMMGGYQLIRRLGRGGMASVYLAYDQKLQREVAVKVLLGIDAADEHFSARFQQEALATARLDHPNIIHIYDYGREGDLIYMVMEYCPNGSLLDVLSNASKQGQPIDPDYTIQIVSQIASALDFAHQRGIIHRDIKPSNILFARDGRPVLADLGIAKALAGPRLTHTMTTIGTPEYMSPEQGRGETVDTRSDLYSLGVVLYELLAGQPPYHADTPWGLIYQHVSEPPPPIRQRNAKVSPALASVVERAMAKNPASRFQTGREMAEALRQAQQKPGRALFAAAPMLTPRPTPTPVPAASRESPTVMGTPLPAVRVAASQPARKGKTARIGLAGVAVAVIGILLALLMQRWSAPSDTAVVQATTAQPIALMDATQTANARLVEVAPTLSATPQAAVAAAGSSVAANTPKPLVTVVERVVERVVTATATATKRGSTPTTMATRAAATSTKRASTTPQTTASIAPTTAAAAASAPPVLLEPADNAQVSGSVTFTWRWVGPTLADGEGFELRVWREGQQEHNGVVPPTRSTQVTFDLANFPGGISANARFFWTVVLVRIQPYKQLVPEATPRVLVWSSSSGQGGGPAESPTPLPTEPPPPTDTPEPPPPTATPEPPPPTATPEPSPTDTPEPPPPTDTPEPLPTDTPEPPPTPEPTPPTSRSFLSDISDETRSASNTGVMLGSGLFVVFLATVRRSGNHKNRGKR